MEDKNVSLKSILEQVEENVKTNLELLKLRLLEKLSEMFSSITLLITLIIMFIVFFSLCNLALALWMSTVLRNKYEGFFILAAFYGIIFLITYLFLGKWIKTKAGNFLIKHLSNHSKWEK
jgi:hypothetical protein